MGVEEILLTESDLGSSDGQGDTVYIVDGPPLEKDIEIAIQEGLAQCPPGATIEYHGKHYSGATYRVEIRLPVVKE